MAEPPASPPPDPPRTFTPEEQKKNIENTVRLGNLISQGYTIGNQGLVAPSGQVVGTLQNVKTQQNTAGKLQKVPDEIKAAALQGARENIRDYAMTQQGGYSPELGAALEEGQFSPVKRVERAIINIEAGDTSAGNFLELQEQGKIQFNQVSDVFGGTSEIKSNAPEKNQVQNPNSMDFGSSQFAGISKMPAKNNMNNEIDNIAPQNTGLLYATSQPQLFDFSAGGQLSNRGLPVTKREREVSEIPKSQFETQKEIEGFVNEKITPVIQEVMPFIGIVSGRGLGGGPLGTEKTSTTDFLGEVIGSSLNIVPQLLFYQGTQVANYQAVNIQTGKEFTPFQKEVMRARTKEQRLQSTVELGVTALTIGAFEVGGQVVGKYAFKNVIPKDMKINVESFDSVFSLKPTVRTTSSGERIIIPTKDLEVVKANERIPAIYELTPTQPTVFGKNKPIMSRQAEVNTNYLISPIKEEDKIVGSKINFVQEVNVLDAGSQIDKNLLSIPVKPAKGIDTSAGELDLGKLRIYNTVEKSEGTITSISGKGTGISYEEVFGKQGAKIFSKTPIGKDYPSVAYVRYPVYSYLKEGKKPSISYFNEYGSTSIDIDAAFLGGKTVMRSTSFKPKAQPLDTQLYSRSYADERGRISFSFEPKTNILTINSFETYPSFQRKGIGRARIEAALEEVSPYATGEKIKIVGSARSDESRAFFTKYGYEKTGSFFTKEVKLADNSFTLDISSKKSPIVSIRSEKGAKVRTTSIPITERGYESLGVSEGKFATVYTRRIGRGGRPSIAEFSIATKGEVPTVKETFGQIYTRKSGFGLKGTGQQPFSGETPKINAPSEPFKPSPKGNYYSRSDYDASLQMQIELPAEAMGRFETPSPKMNLRNEGFTVGNRFNWVIGTGLGNALGNKLSPKGLQMPKQKNAPRTSNPDDIGQANPPKIDQRIFEDTLVIRLTGQTKTPDYFGKFDTGTGPTPKEPDTIIGAPSYGRNNEIGGGFGGGGAEFGRRRKGNKRVKARYRDTLSATLSSKDLF